MEQRQRIQTSQGCRNFRSSSSLVELKRLRGEFKNFQFSTSSKFQFWYNQGHFETSQTFPVPTLVTCITISIPFFLKIQWSCIQAPELKAKVSDHMHIASSFKLQLSGGKIHFYPTIFHYIHMKILLCVPFANPPCPLWTIWFIAWKHSNTVWFFFPATSVFNFFCV